MQQLKAQLVLSYGSHLLINDRCVYLQGFVAYLKSVMMASNKKIFDVTRIDLDDFARLIRSLLQFAYTVTHSVFTKLTHPSGVIAADDLK